MLPVYPTPGDVAAIVEYAVIKERNVDSIQITGGSIFSIQVEFDKIRSIRQRHLNAVEYIASKYGEKKQAAIYNQICGS